MSLPLFLVAALPSGPSHVLDGPEGHHAADVQRLLPGEALLLSDGAGGLVRGVVTSARKGALTLALDEPAFVPAPDPSLTVVQGIAKGERAELAVQLLTEVGVDRIVPWQAARSIARWKDERPLLRWQATAREAAKQSRRAWVPAVSAACATRQLSLSGTVLVLHEEASVPLSAVPLPASGEITLVVGPEGGVAPEELDAIGGTAVRLGPEVLRTSTAGAAAVAALSVRLGRW
ncbi:16S rRNA (uracil(1498)-N(3))-methyltransferase [Dactylosporangium sp. CS-033363]|uniref:16S rRNA (uracil(1498)-N(3))-methyltransferase n=1 Tax=Dactylosporangium sp. CS-033363 TaxID=3239935 RepID=UPI003D92BDA9